MQEAGFPAIHTGRDGWLFLTGGSNNVSDQFTRSIAMAWRLYRWRRLIVARSSRFARLGIDYRHVVVPDKITIYDHRLGEGLDIRVGLSLASRLGRSVRARGDAGRAYLDLIAPFRERRDAADLFHRNDTHWTFEGCLLAYRVICASVDAAPRDDFRERPCEVVRSAGDLGGKFDPAVVRAWPVYALQRDARRVFASPVVRAREASGRSHTLHRGAHVVYANATAGADPRRVLLFGDSFSHFTPTALTIMLAETFREVHFIWSPGIDWRHVARVRPDLVVTQIAERFLFHLANDRFDLDAYAEQRFSEETRSLQSDPSACAGAR